MSRITKEETIVPIMSIKHYHVLYNDADKNLSDLNEEMNETKFCLDEKNYNVLTNSKNKLMRWNDCIQRKKLLLIFIFVLSWVVLFNLIPTSSGKMQYVQNLFFPEEEHISSLPPFYCNR